MSTELLAQLNALIAGAEANAGRSRTVAGDPPPDDRGGLRPAHHARRRSSSLVPNVHGINEILAATQEVVPASAGSKFPRRKLTPDDERTIRLLAGQNFAAEQIAAEPRCLTQGRRRLPRTCRT